MKKHPPLPAVFALVLSFFAPALWNAGADEERPLAYPFDVTLAGQSAKVEGNSAIFAKIAKPVPNDAEMVLRAEKETIFVNIFRCNEKGEVSQKDSAKAKIIMAPDANRVKLNATMDKSVLEDGLYLMNVVLSSKGTSRVMFRIGEAKVATTGKIGNAIDQSKPEAVVRAIFAAAKSGDFTSLKVLLPPSGKCDGDVKNVCGVDEANDKGKAEFRAYFEKGNVTGTAEISEDGNKAAVDFLFGPTGKKPETMNLVKEDGKWYLESF